MTTEYVMRAFKTTSPTGHVYWSSVGSADTDGYQSGYNPSDLSGITVDYTTTTNTPSNPITPTGLAGGDLAGTYPNPVVIRLQGTPVDARTPSDHQVLTYIPADSGPGGSWQPITPSSGGGGAPTGAAGGDLSGTYPNPGIAQIQGYTVNFSGAAANKALVFDSSVSSIVPGTPDANATFIGGQYRRVIQGSGQPTIGNVLTWTTNNGWEPAPPATAGSAGGDLGGTYPNPTVNQIRGHAIVPGNPNNGDQLTFAFGAWQHLPASIQGSPVAVNYPAGSSYQLPGSGGTIPDGSVLTFNSTSGFWNAAPAAGGTDITAVRTVNLDSVSPVPQPSDYLILCTGTSGAGNIILPPTSTTGKTFRFKDASGQGTITINGNGNLIDGASTYVMTAHYSAVYIYFNGTGWNLL